VAERDVAPAVADDRAPGDVEIVFGGSLLHEARRRFAAAAAVARMRAPIPAVERDAVGREPARDLGVHRAHVGIAEVSTRDPGLIRDHHRRVTVVAQQPQCVDDGRQDHHALRVAEKAFVLDDRSVAVQKDGRTSHGRFTRTATLVRPGRR
jgi:hypothetical protein